MSVKLAAVIVKFLPATNTLGARYSVTNGRTGKRTTVPFSYESTVPERDAVVAAFEKWGAPVSKLESENEEGGKSYYMAYMA